ncbi:PH, RCC1 and FYVE domains-containing protein 1 [Aegilops tauschii subsp. strangulata]|uniref:E3 ubiquitin-protein ligase HERC2 n=1 Tax=Aegilops tauschii subsp. strangulata TaxID=200361 RepID=A0A453DIZ6_AEGTS|nr:PH, RCC1 and FYVE domains-containing protein 1 [Aegilops tauschii subsp. strangulata]
MADPVVDIDKALIALKKGTQLLKYGRKGKPKFTPFRLSTDESTLIWVSSNQEKSLKLASVSRVLSGQRTLVFQRFLLPEKDHLSFSLIYKDGKRSLDLICKDKVETQVWFTCLSALVSPGKHRSQPQHTDEMRSSALSFDCGRESSLSSSSTFTTDSLENKLSSANSKDRSSGEYAYSERTDVSDMQVKSVSSSDIRVSVSSALSTSSHGSGGEDSESFGDVYVWGEVMCDTASVSGSDGNTLSPGATTDILVPKPLESNVMLDVSSVACGVKHAALITRQAEVFTWGEECSGRLGHGAGTSIFQPRLLESLSTCNVEIMACGEFHTCAVTATGDLYTWGDGTHNAGLLGHGSTVSHWIPKRVSGPLEGLQVSTVSCGTWHTALITTSGLLYTFGDGTFGALGHGNRETISYPKEVESLKGLRTISVSCGVWHSAAVVEIIMTQSNASSGKLFTWGDGDKYRLGHGDRASKLKPTCVSSLIDYNFHKSACGHTLTIGLTTSGHMFTVGSSVYGQLGNPNNDGRYARLVEDKVGGGGVVEVACGSYHVAVLTNAGEVYTWGKGANGRLGHGDIADRKVPTLVEALRDRSVKRIACGSSFTAAICQHKWVSGMEQSQCSACRQPFGFTRKRHNCYHCGLVHCHSCSSKKALRAALSPNPGKPYRVCDSCHMKLSKVMDSGLSYNRNNIPRVPGDTKAERMDTKANRVASSTSSDMIKSLDVKAAKQAKRSDHSPQFPAILQMNDVPFIGSGDLHTTGFTVTNGYPNDPRYTSQFLRMPYLSSPSSVSSESLESFRDANELLKQEVQKLKEEVNSLRQQRELQDAELKKSEAKASEAAALAAEEASKSKAAKEVIKSLTAQVKEMAERLPAGDSDVKPPRVPYLPAGGVVSPEMGREGQKRYEPVSIHYSQTPTSVTSSWSNGLPPQAHQIGKPGDNTVAPHENMFENFNKSRDFPATHQRTNSAMSGYRPRSEDFDRREAERFQINLQDWNTRGSGSPSNQVESEWIEQFEPGVYLTLVTLHDGTKELKRVRFSRRRFAEHQAESWWSDNHEKVYDKYNLRRTDRISSVLTS